MDSTLKMRPEDELLLLCSKISLNAETEIRIKLLINNDFDWDYLVKMATYHKLIPLIYLNLNKTSKNLIPSNINNDLKQFFNKNAEKNLFFVMELIKILKIFKKHGISLISYKGPLLAYFAYGNLAMRQFVDLDFLVKPKDFTQAKEILHSIGYEPELKLDEKQEKKFIASQQEFKFFNRDNKITLDLHWKLSLLHFPAKTGYLIQKTSSVEIFNKSIRTLSQEEMFLLICIHNSSHRWRNISLLCDLNGFILKNEGLNWVDIKHRAKVLGITRIVNINLYLIKNILNSDLSPELGDTNEDNNAIDIAQQIQKKIIKGFITFSLFEEWMITLKIRDSAILGLRDVITSVFMPTSYEWKKIPLPAQISFIYLIIRPFLLLSRYKI